MSPHTQTPWKAGVGLLSQPAAQTTTPCLMCLSSWQSISWRRSCYSEVPAWHRTEKMGTSKSLFSNWHIYLNKNLQQFGEKKCICINNAVQAWNFILYFGETEVWLQYYHLQILLRTNEMIVKKKKLRSKQLQWSNVYKCITQHKNKHTLSNHSNGSVTQA